MNGKKPIKPKARFRTKEDAIAKAKIWASATQREIIVYCDCGSWGRIDAEAFQQIDQSNITQIFRVSSDGTVWVATARISGERLRAVWVQVVPESPNQPSP